MFIHFVRTITRKYNLEHTQAKKPTKIQQLIHIMSEIHDDDDDNNAFSSQENNCLKILLNSLVLFSRNKRIFFLIFTLTVIPLSFLHFSLSFSCHAIKNHIYSLEALAGYAPTGFESRHVWQESRANALSLLRLKFLYFLPSYLLSLVAAITTVNSTYSAVNNRRFTLRTAIASVTLTWKRPLVTTFCIYVVLVLFSQLFFVSAVVTGNNSLSPGPTLFVWAVGSVLQVYLMAVLGLGLVVSVLEDRFGFDAVMIGSGMMEGRMACGWFLSVWFALLSGLIGWRREKLMAAMMDGGNKWTVVMGSWERVGLICLHGIEVIWSYVVTTVFYCECSTKRHVIISENDSNVVTV